MVWVGDVSDVTSTYDLEFWSDIDTNLSIAKLHNLPMQKNKHVK